MAKRLSGEVVNIEYNDSTNRMRLASEVVNLEYNDEVNRRRLASLAVMIEYIEGATITGRVYGPAMQMSG